MRPKNQDYEEIQRALKDAFPSVDTELHRDLWPPMLRRLEEQPLREVPWYDWALAAALAGIAILFPKIALLFAYHL